MPEAEALDRVAILVLAFNHADFIGQCLESAEPYLRRGARLWVLDDGSTDRTCDIVEAFARQYPAVTLIRQPHTGRSSLNSQRLVRESAGEYITTMSGDDMFGPGRMLDRAVDLLDADPALAMVMPRMIYVADDPGAATPPSCAPALLDVLRSGSPVEVLDRHLQAEVSRIFLQSMVLRRCFVDDFGGFDVELSADDYAFNLRMFRAMAARGLRFRYDERSVWLYRLHAANAHRDATRQFSLIVEAVSKYVDPDRRHRFRWDAVTFKQPAEVSAARRIARAALGQVQGDRALAPSVRATVREWMRQGQASLIGELLLDKDAALAHRGAAGLYLAKAIANRHLSTRMKR